MAVPLSKVIKERAINDQGEYIAKKRKQLPAIKPPKKRLGRSQLLATTVTIHKR